MTLDQNTATDRSVAIAVNGEAKATLPNGNSVSVDGSLEARYDLITYEKTFSGEIHGALAADGLSAQADAKVEVVVGSDNQVKEIDVSGSVQAQGSGGAQTIVRQLTGQDATMSTTFSSGAEVAFSAKLDPTNAAVQSNLELLMSGHGTPSQLVELFGHSEAQVQVDSVASVTDKGSVVNITWETGQTSTQNLETFAKPLDGSWVRVN